MNTDTDQLRNLTEWMLDRLDRQQPARAALSKAAARLDAAQRLHDTRHTAMQLEVAALNSDTQRTLTDLHARPSAATLAAYCAATDYLATSRERHATERDALGGTLAAARAGIAATVRLHSAALLPLVTAERCHEVTRCGVDAVPPQARALHSMLDLRLHPSLPPELTLPVAMRSTRNAAPLSALPLTWSQHDTAALRASLAWCWLELHAGRFIEANAPLNTRQKAERAALNSNGKCLRLVSACDALPAVQPTVPLEPKR
jgi:hypothetical protein